MFHAACASTAPRLLTKAELRSMMKDARENFTESGVTGMLLYSEGSFLQVLEGHRDEVIKLVDRIKVDPLHKDLHTLLNGEMEHHLFHDWTMAFRNLTDASLSRAPGFSDFLNTPYTGDEFSDNPASCLRLLLSFKKNMQRV